jgi:hypothetical protein
MNDSSSATSAAPAYRALRILIASPPAVARSPKPKHTPSLANALRSLGCSVHALDWGSDTVRTSLARRAAVRTKNLLTIWLAALRMPAEVVVIKTAHDWATVLDDPDSCHRMGRENKRMVAGFAPERMAAEHVHVLLEIVGRS